MESKITPRPFVQPHVENKEISKLRLADLCEWNPSVQNKMSVMLKTFSWHWRHNGRDVVSNHQPYDCLLNRLFRRRSKKTTKLRVTGLCEGISPGTGEFPAQMTSNAENVFIWWRHHAKQCRYRCVCWWVGGLSRHNRVCFFSQLSFLT